MTNTEKNRIIASIENSSLSSNHRAQIVELIEAIVAKENMTEEENEQWNPYADDCYKAQDIAANPADYYSEHREMARMQALAGYR